MMQPGQAGRARLARHEGACHEVRRVVDAGRVVPRPGDGIAAVRGGGGAELHGPAGNADVAGRAVDLRLRVLAPVAQQMGMAGGERERPAGRGAAPRDLGHDRDEVAQGELVATEAARLQSAVEARLDEVGLGLVEDLPGGLGGGLALAEERREGDRALEHLRGREVRLRRCDGCGRDHVTTLTIKTLDRQGAASTRPSSSTSVRRSSG